MSGRTRVIQVQATAREGTTRAIVRSSACDPERSVESVRYRAPKSEFRKPNYLGLLFLRIAHRPYVAMNLPATAFFATHKDVLTVTEPKAAQTRSTVSATIKASQT